MRRMVPRTTTADPSSDSARPSITAAVEASTAWASPSRAVSTSSPINWLPPTGMM